jgi:UDP-N-acetylglucosamine--N-acetylmuramyl-(pentapeptide) pyrophosphoryl-undecaprenol N-acetylglucosamine transferase
MTIVVTGAGSGGHITPVLAVAKELKRLDSHLRIVYVGQRGDQFSDLSRTHASIDDVSDIQAGKFRRYHGEGLKQLLDVKTMLLNLRDSYRVTAGFFQALGLLRREKPAAVFVKGGFVGVPVGLAAALLRIPYVTHDSDAIPGLTNRIIAPWAKYHAVALPKELYKYPQDKAITVGVPVADQYQTVTPAAQVAAKTDLGYDKSAKLLLVTGGGLGAQRLNSALLSIAHDLLAADPELHIVHVAGRLNEADVEAGYREKLAEAERGRVKVLGYTNDMHAYSAAADLIITRAGATSIAEFARQGKACILIPSPFLTGGHQLKNAAALQQAKAVAVLEEESLRSDLPLVLSTVTALLQDVKAREQLAHKLQVFAHPKAATELAELILKTANRNVS